MLSLVSILASSYWEKKGDKIFYNKVLTQEKILLVFSQINFWVGSYWFDSDIIFQIVLGDVKQQEEKTTKAQEYNPEGYKTTKSHENNIAKHFSLSTINQN